MLDKGKFPSRADVMIPFADSEDLANPSGATLFEVGNDHRLADLELLAAMPRMWESVTAKLIGCRYPAQLPEGSNTHRCRCRGGTACVLRPIPRFQDRKLQRVDL